MQLLDDRPFYSATDINNFLACEHLTSLELDVLNGVLARPPADGGQGPLLSQLGEEHEQRYLQRLIASGRAVAHIERGRGLAGLRDAATATAAAMARGDDYIYQATFLDGEWVGHADFLRKVDSQLDGCHWAWHYEVEDAKLARHTEPYFLLQLAYYSEHVARIQGASATTMHVVLGNDETATFRVADVNAYYHSVRTRFLAHVTSGARTTYPQPVSHCGLCVWRETCEQRWTRDDHLSLIANSTRLQVERLNGAGITTLHGLVDEPLENKPSKMAVATFEKLRRQARLQHEQRLAIAAGEPDPYKYELLAPNITTETAPKRGLYRLPAPSEGDVFFDMEGDPYYDIGTGLEYMFGAYTLDEGFQVFWGCDRSASPTRDRLAERRAFEAFIDFVMLRRARDPNMHVYHYASYEKTALQKLAQRHLTREDELDIILREERLVDLYAIVLQSVVIGQPGYSIKLLEAFYGKRGSDSGIAAGDDSILRFEEWRALRYDPVRRDDTILDDLMLYNRYDCISTHGLRDWLLDLRAEAMRTFSVEIPPYAGKEAEPPPETKDPYLALKANLSARIPEEYDPESADRNAPVWTIFLARHMLEYHWRERKPELWRFHDRCDTYRNDPAALLDDSESLIGLEFESGPVPVKKSVAYTFRFPSQLHKIDGGECFDLHTKDSIGTVLSVDDGDDYGRLVVKRSPKAPAAFPTAITIQKFIPPSTVRDAIARFAAGILEAGDRCRYRAAFDVLLGRAPRLSGLRPGTVLQPAIPDVASLLSLCNALDESYLFVQGPPGSGKTYLGARLIIALLAAGKRVGVTANSHRAIHNMLDEVEVAAGERAFHFTGLKKLGSDKEESRYDSVHITATDTSLAVASANLVAGTAWAFGPNAMDEHLDYLFVDEAGQVSLPHAIAAMTAAKNTVFLGDPLQLPHITHTHHPGDIGESVLEHLLDDELRPIAPDRGVLLTDSYRMHEDVCSFISDLLYEGRLKPAAGRNRQTVESPGLAGTGLRYVPIAHSGNSQRSDEEADRIVAEIALLMQGRVRDVHDAWHAIGTGDIIVVTPYNAQVRGIRRALDRAGYAAIEVGTVDKFQGREAYVVFFSTAASTPDEAPRGTGFIFDRQRFNVAISRARALAVMIGSPALVNDRVTSIEGVRVANGLCRFIERAT